VVECPLWVKSGHTSYFDSTVICCSTTTGRVPARCAWAAAGHKPAACRWETWWTNAGSSPPHSWISCV